MLTPYNGDSLDLVVVGRAFFNQVRTINGQLRGINPAGEIHAPIAEVVWVQIAALSSRQLKCLEGLWNVD